MRGAKRTVRGNKKGVKGTEGPKRGRRATRKGGGIAMKPRGKGVMAQSRVSKMEKADPAV